MSDARTNSTISLAVQAHDGGRKEPPHLWLQAGRAPRTPCRLEQPPSPGRAQKPEQGVAPAAMAFFLAIFLAVGVRQWKEVHRKRDYAAVNPVKYNDVFLSIFS